MTTEELFDLVAPIAITGGADVAFIDKAKRAWHEIAFNVTGDVWEANGCPSPAKALAADPSVYVLSDNDDFADVYNAFAIEAYRTLFDAIVSEHGDGKWEHGHDYWGAEGYSRPGDTNKTFSLVGDTDGQLPWYETADLLIERIREIEQR